MYVSFTHNELGIQLQLHKQLEKACTCVITMHCQSIYIIESVCLFVCLFAVNAKTTARIDPKCSGMTKNNPESVLCCLKSPVLVLSERYRDISGFSFAADRHFTYLSSTSGSYLDA